MNTWVSHPLQPHTAQHSAWLRLDAQLLKVSVHQQMNASRRRGTYIQRNIPRAQKEWNNAATWMGLEISILGEVSQKDKDRQHMASCFWESNIWHMWACLWNRNRLTDIENRLVAAKGKEEGGGWTGRLGLVDLNYYIENGQTTRNCYIENG